MHCARLPLLFLVCVALAPATRGDDAAATSSDARLDRLLEQAAAQQRQLESLRRQAASVADKPAETARADALREQIRAILREHEFRESLSPTVMAAGYDSGFFIRSSDERFRLNINGFAQFRWTHYATGGRNRYLRPRLERDDRTGFDVQRVRLILSGHAFSPDLTYHLHFRADGPDGYDVVPHWLFVNYRFRDEVQFRAGIFKLASSRSQLTPENGFQFVDRPMTDAVFGLGNGLGVRLWGHLFEKRLDYLLDVVNSLNSPANRTITPDPAEHDSNPAILARLVWHAMGDDLKTWLHEGDPDRHESPHVDVGFSYAFNEDDGDRATLRMPFPAGRRAGAGGGFAVTSSNGTQIHQFSWDAALKYMGFSATGEYFLRLVDPRQASGLGPITPWTLFSWQDDTAAQHGAVVQVGYFLPIPGAEKKIEAVARVGGVSTLASGREGTWEYAGGLNYYFEGRRAKLQTDVTKVSESPVSNRYSSLANVNDDALIWRVQLQIAF